MPYIEALAQQLGGQAAQGLMGGAMGLLFQGGQDRRQIRQAEKLQNLQVVGQKHMMDYGYEKQLQMWKDTNYKAQVEQLEMAGLNPGLLYGMSGGGGATTGTAQGTTTGQQAPHGGGEVLTMAKTAMELGLQRAQQKNIEADTRLKDADTKKTEGVDTKHVETQISSLSQGIENQKAAKKLMEIETELKNIDKEVKSKTIEAQQDLIVNAAAKGVEEIDILHQQLLLDRAQRMDKVKLLQAEVAGMLVKNILTKAQIELTGTEVTKITEELKQGWEGLDRQERELKLKTWEANIKAKYPQIGAVGGRMLNEAARQLGRIFGEETETHTPIDTKKKE